MTFVGVIQVLGRTILLIAAGSIAIVPFVGAAQKANEHRVALVVGISAYENAPRLNDPINDARAIGDSLRRLQFDVAELYDPDLSALKGAVGEFGLRAAQADVAVIYYAGYGLQVDQKNFLIPVEAKPGQQGDLANEAMPLDLLLDDAAHASHIGIVLLDGSRNNPFVEVGAKPGLARIEDPPRHTVLATAARSNQIAEDGAEHSQFAAALLSHLQIPGLELGLFFRSIRETVLHATNNRQEPYVFSSLGNETFYFYPRALNSAAIVGPN